MTKCYVYNEIQTKPARRKGENMKFHLIGAVLLLASITAANGQTQIVADGAGLPASDVLGNEDIWENPTFVGGVINGGPTASSEY
jgi:hypothetical protein